MTVRGILYAVAAAFCFGIMPIITKFVYKETNVDPFFYLMLRYTMAAVIIWAYVLCRPGRSWQKVDRSSMGITILTSASYIIVTASYFVALKFIDASLATLLVFTFPVFTPFIGALFFKQKLSWWATLAAIIGFFGCGLLIGNYQLKGISGELMGIGLGLAAGLMYAFYTLFGQKITIRVEPLIVTAYNLAFVAFFFLLLRFQWLWQNPQPLLVYAAAMVLAIVSTVLANTFYFEAIKRIGAVKAGIFGSIEPLFTTVLAVTFLNDQLVLLQWLGALFILGGMILLQRPWCSKYQLNERKPMPNPIDL
jgi:drug/metabolite transporter (DMT)-like permease